MLNHHWWEINSNRLQNCLILSSIKGFVPEDDQSLNFFGNSSQIAKMIADFKTAKRTLRTSNSQLHVRAVNGCCYGQDNNPDKGDYYKYCGQKFWEFISGNANLYTDIIEPLGNQAKEQNEAFQNAYAHVINRFIREFTVEFCKDSGQIDWHKIVRLNSAFRLK